MIDSSARASGTGNSLTAIVVAMIDLLSSAGNSLTGTGN
jgi:hypothetical protein